MVTNFTSYNLILTMNKLFKYLLVGIATFSILFASFSSADFYCNPMWAKEFYQPNLSNYTIELPFSAVEGSDAFCITNNSDTYLLGFNFDNSATYTYLNQRQAFCSDDNTITHVYFHSNDRFIDPGVVLYPSNCITQVYTSLQCQTEYNLIPIENVTANYCKLNYDLIDPSECPVQPSGTGAVNRSSLFINNTQYPGNSTISIGIPDYIGRSITYNDDENIVDIEGYNADEEYINNVIDNEKLTPTNSDFENMLTGLVNFFPYLAIAILFYFLIKVVYKIFK